MALFDRIRHLLKADAHGVVDALEDEALVLRQCVRDAEAALDAKRARRAALTAESKRLRAEVEGLDGRIERLDGDVELALGEGQEELARYSLRQLLPLRRGRQAAVTRLEAVEREAAELDEVIDAEDAALEALKARVAERLSRLASSPDRPADGGGTVRDEDIELELLRRRRKASGVMRDAMGDAMGDAMRDGVSDGMPGADAGMQGGAR